MERYICIHGHFYQPPRENPWLGEIELQDSAYPYHDWNEKIAAQCYAPNTASRILDEEQRIIEIVNNYSRISFNLGPTLLSWLERHRPACYAAILEADRISRNLFTGHGSALAQAYNHPIMPLANQRDKSTQILWGISDFRRRFGREPEGMWLPETAVDIETLEILAAQGIRFTLLAPRQARRVKKMVKGTRWEDVSNEKIDPSMAYLCQLPSKKSITLFFYDGPVSRDIAFGELADNGEGLAGRLASTFDDARGHAQLGHVAVDGETFGHHHRHGDRALAYCLHLIESRQLARLTNYGEFLERHPPTHLVQIHENSSWSCIHGIERWQSNCGCNSGQNPGWSQAWRRPLREALDWLRDETAPIYEERVGRFVKSPWQARNDYIDVVLDRSAKNVDRFLRNQMGRTPTDEEKTELLRLFEMERNALLMYSSCGWFFDEISGIETVQILQYAACVIQLAEEFLGRSLEADFLQRLAFAPSNLFENGAKVYEMFVKPARLDLLRVGVHYAVSSLFEDYTDVARIYCYTVACDKYHLVEAGKFRLAIGKILVRSDITWQHAIVSFAVLHLGDHNINGGARLFQGEQAFTDMRKEIRAAFDRADISEVLRLMDNHFGVNNFSIWHLFRDEQRKVIAQVLRLSDANIEASFRQIHENNSGIMNFLQSLNIPLPRPLSFTAEHIFNSDLKRLFETEESIDARKLEGILANARRWHLALDLKMLRFAATEWLNRVMEKVEQQTADLPLFKNLADTLSLLESEGIEPDLWKAQNAYFSIAQGSYNPIQEKAESGDAAARQWVEIFQGLSSILKVRVT
ncbi:MAG: glycoside hydrolase [Deltaproteobacteria bacterium RIFOXYD12_FULL_57_12]|nr:MAG: glycoside hydrolase [Deltaproteobacteria bacterium RIFOXYD12_FULL_57_12]